MGKTGLASKMWPLTNTQLLFCSIASVKFLLIDIPLGSSSVADDLFFLMGWVWQNDTDQAISTLKLNFAKTQY